MTVTCRPALASLTRIVSVLHARGCEVLSLRYLATADTGSIVARIAGSDGARLAAQVERVVDVTDVQVCSSAALAVA